MALAAGTDVALNGVMSVYDVARSRPEHVFAANEVNSTSLSGRGRKEETRHTLSGSAPSHLITPREPREGEGTRQLLASYVRYLATPVTSGRTNPQARE